MSYTTRRILFYVLFGAFFLLAPLVIAYSLGYSIDFQKRTFEQTGSIFVRSENPRVSILLNGAAAKETSLLSNGALLTGISPGTYLIRVEKEGYRPWSKAVTVSPTLVTELRTIVLIPEPLPVASSTPEERVALAEATSTIPVRQIVLDKKANLVARQEALERILATRVHSFGSLREAIYFIDQKGTLSRIDPIDGSVTVVGKPGFTLGAKKAEFLGSSAGDVVIIDSARNLFLLESEDNLFKVGSGIVAARFDESAQKLLISRKDEIEIIWLEKNQYQPFQEKGTKEVIFRVESAILDAHWWHGDDAHIIIRTLEGIYFTEIDGRGGRNTFELYSGPTDEILTIPDLPQTVLFRTLKTWHTIKI